MDKVFIYEAACSSRVQKHLDRMYLASVSGTDLDRKGDRCSVGIKTVGGELFGESLFPFWPPRQDLLFWSEVERCDYRFNDICIDLFYIQYREPIY